MRNLILDCKLEIKSKKNNRLDKKNHPKVVYVYNVIGLYFGTNAFIAIQLIR